MAVNIELLEDRVLVKADAAEETTKSGLYIPDTAKEKSLTGEVVAVGPGKKDLPMTLKVGDKVTYGKYGGGTLALDGEEYLIMRMSDIYGVLKSN